MIDLIEAFRESKLKDLAEISAMPDNDWIVGTHGGPRKKSWEVFVARRTNLHAFRSYGWSGKEKHMISSSDTGNETVMDSIVWEGLKSVAQEYADRLNKKKRNS